MEILQGLTGHRQYNEHMGCVKRCLDYLGSDTSLPWLFGGTANAFVLNMNDTVFVVRDRLRALAEMHPERHGNADWSSTLTSPRGAALVREAAVAESKGVGSLRDVMKTL